MTSNYHQFIWSMDTILDSFLVPEYMISAEVREHLIGNKLFPFSHDESDSSLYYIPYNHPAIIRIGPMRDTLWGISYEYYRDIRIVRTWFIDN